MASVTDSKDIEEDIGLQVLNHADHMPGSPANSARSTSDSIRELESSATEERNRDDAPVLAPIDKGRKAWTFVLCSFVLEMLIWGFPFSFGVFQHYYSQTPPFNTASESTIGSIGTVSIAFQYMELPFVIALAQRKPRWVRTMTWTALCTCSGALLLSSLATAVWHLVALQGVVVGISGGFLYAPIVIWLSEWFVERRSLAGSLIFGGSGLGGAFFPLLINFLLTSTGGFRWALRILAAIIAVCGGIALLGVKPRLPVARVSNPNPSTSAGISPNLNFFKSPLFITVSLTTMTQALAYFPVSLYIPSYSTSVGLSTVQGTIALSVFNLARVIGQVVFGHVCDKTAYTWVMIFSGIGSTLSAYLLWGFAHNLGIIFAFVVIFGSVSGGFSSTSPPASADIVGPGAQSGMVYGCINVFKGIAVIIGPLISAALHERASTTPAKYGGYGFTSVTIFVGSMMAVTTAGGFLTMFFRARKA